MIEAPRGGLLPMSRRVMNLSHFMRQSARRFAAELALAWGEGRWSWAELDRRIDAAASGLAALGVSKGDRVLVQSRNGNQMIEAMFACFRLGAIYVPTNFRQTAEEVGDLARSSRASTMICAAEFQGHADAVSSAMPGIRLIAIGPASFAGDWDTMVARHDGQAAVEAAVQYDDPCWFFFTSGTTGRPKASVLTHGQMAFVINNHLCDLLPGMTHRDASLVLAPLSHGAGVHLLMQVACGVKSILPAGDRFDAEEAWALVARWRITNMFTVPTIVKLLTEHPAVDRTDHSSLRHVIYAGAPMYREDQKFALSKLGRVLVQYFGLGEVTGAITVFAAELHDVADTPTARAGTCGVARTGMQVSIQDDRGAEVAPFETGEICVCGPAVFAGYYDNAEANEKAFRDGWFRTGDLGHMDDEGFVFITGRASDMYISGGSNVYPREIEEKVLRHPAVAEVAILGVPDRAWGEVGVAVCVLREGASLTEQEVIAFLEGQVTRYKLPRRVVFWDSLPKSAYGKITKKIIRAELEARETRV